MKINSANKFKIFYLFFCSIYVFAETGVVTNLPLWKEVCEWRAMNNLHNSAQVLNEINKVVGAAVAPWKIPVLKGEGWDYKWGFFVGVEKARALLNINRPAQAFDALVNATGYLPALPPKPYDIYFFQWYVLYGKTCVELNRRQDAENYLLYARNNLSTNEELYIDALAELASLYGFRGNYKKSNKLYNELFTLRPKQPSAVWRKYIQILFNSGDYEKGVAMIFQGVSMNGISPRFVEQDYFVKCACRYWHLFRDIDIVEWYEILGEQLNDAELKKGNEKLFALLINTRKMMAKIYPEFFTTSDDDLAALKKRLSESENKRKAQIKKIKERKAARKNFDNNYKNIACDFSQKVSADFLIENEVNKVMAEAARMSKYARGNTKSWKKILEKFDTNQLANVEIDGASALFLIYSQLGVIYWDQHNQSNAVEWLTRAIELPDSGKNYYRFTEALLCLSDAYLRLRNYEKADYFLDWAKDLAKENAVQFMQAKSALAYREYSKSGIDNQISMLEEIVENFGCKVRQKDYKQLARDYLQKGEFDKSFDVIVESIKRLPLRIFGGFYHPMVNSLTASKSFLTSEQLKRFRKLIKTSAMRVPATLAGAPKIAKILAMANEPWIDEQIKLSEIEESKNFSDENFAFISNKVFSTENIRAGLLFTEAQAARDAANTNYFDWTGWLNGWWAIDKEMRTDGRPSKVDYKMREIANGKFIAQLEKYKNRIDTNSFAKIKSVLYGRINKLKRRQIDKISELFNVKFEERRED